MAIGSTRRIRRTDQKESPKKGQEIRIESVKVLLLSFAVRRVEVVSATTYGV